MIAPLAKYINDWLDDEGLDRWFVERGVYKLSFMRYRDTYDQYPLIALVVADDNVRWVDPNMAPLLGVQKAEAADPEFFDKLRLMMHKYVEWRRSL